MDTETMFIVGFGAIITILVGIVITFGFIVLKKGSKGVKTQKEPVSG